ncbi:DNA-binding protein [Pectobacterium brasiliense]|uniref:integrase n=1 Tax=Pectobacterium brasiliense TaxID=180957 RepID=UPI000CE69941|nr:integrase [Pectobacterium brasiliense]PPE59276.1 DNA-binding protein [Pectobacterium brasiliense]
MADVFQFKPRTEITAEENLRAFINKCRDELTVFGSKLDWNTHIWPKLAVFAKLGVTTRKPTLDQLLDDDFVEFAKAYFRYQQGHKPTGSKNELKALRAVESALIQVNGNASIMGLSIDCLDEAIVLTKQHYSDGAAYQCGREIERLAEFVTNHHLIPANLKTWKSTIARPSDTTKTGKEAKAARDKKLPNEIALNALAEIFANDPNDNRDIFTTTVFAMLMSAPSRITEILTLPADCEVIEKDKKGVERYGWRFFSGKGFEGDIKWIPTVMVEVAKTAVKRAKKLSSEARKLAAWIENNPDKFYRHKNCPKVSNTARLTMQQACQALGLANDTRKNCRSGLHDRRLEANDGVHTLDSLWVHVKERLPEGFPWLDQDKGIKYSNALFALNKNQLHGNRGCLPVELHKPTNNFFNNDIITRDSLGDSHRSIFDRYEYRSETGQRLKVTSHQARHLLNTIGQRGGLSNLEIAKWSGRADVKQNRTYNHMTEYEMVAMAERIDTSKTMFGPVGDVSKHLPVTTKEFNTLEQAAAHVTEYGFCVHDYTMSPCEKYRDCINCTEQVCIKGDSSKLERMKERLERTEGLLKNAEKDVEEGDAGADRWFTYHQKTATRLRELVRILENPKIEEGAQIKLRGNDFSQLRRVAQKKAVESISSNHSNNEEASILEDLTKMLGGGIG